MFAARKTDNVSSAANYIEECFSVYLYTGNGSTQTITNGIDLAGKGGMVWLKPRSESYSHKVYDTVRGVNTRLLTNTTDAGGTGYLTSFNSDGFSKNYDLGENTNGQTYASWTFREQAKFFDVVTYTGNGASGARAIAHNLGSTPGCYIVKRTDSTSFWPVYHRMMNGGTNPHNYWMALETTSSQALNTAYFGAAPTSTNFYVADNINANGASYVAYLFAHDAGGFGAAGTDNVISCGSFTTDGSGNATVTLGYEPQWVMLKRSDSTGNWLMMDAMRGMPVTANSSTQTGGRLYANLSNADDGFPSVIANATGFTTVPGTVAASATYIYIAIRRGPMKTPTSGTSVFNLARTTEPSSTPLLSPGTPPPDTVLHRPRLTETQTFSFADRLRGDNLILGSANTNAEQSATANIVPPWKFSSGQNAQIDASAYYNNSTSFNYVAYSLVRASGFMDVVCYTGTGSATTQTHNLGVAPELLIVKSRDTAVNWVVWASAPTPQQNQYALNLNTAGAWGSSGDKNWGATLIGAPNMTSTTFSLGDYVGVNGSAKTYVAYLFASCPGVSKVGSYTGTGALQTINCGFAAGARFVLIKRTDSTGDWWVYDSARGISSGNDPYLFLNSTAAEVTNTNYVDTASTGFQVTAAAPAGLNANGGTYIFLAIA